MSESLVTLLTNYFVARSALRSAIQTEMISTTILGDQSDAISCGDLVVLTNAIGVLSRLAARPMRELPFPGNDGGGDPGPKKPDTPGRDFDHADAIRRDRKHCDAAIKNIATAGNMSQSEKAKAITEVERHHELCKANGSACLVIP